MYIYTRNCIYGVSLIWDLIWESYSLEGIGLWAAGIPFLIVGDVGILYSGEGPRRIFWEWQYGNIAMPEFSIVLVSEISRM